MKKIILLGFVAVGFLTLGFSSASNSFEQEDVIDFYNSLPAWEGIVEPRKSFVDKSKDTVFYDNYPDLQLYKSFDDKDPEITIKKINKNYKMDPEGYNNNFFDKEKFIHAEYGYELSGPMVYSIKDVGKDRFLKVNYDKKFYWLKDKNKKFNLYYYEDLIIDGLSGIYDWDGKIRQNANDKNSEIVFEGFEKLKKDNEGEVSVDVLGSKNINGELWFEVKILDQSPCEVREEPKIVAKGFVKAHDKNGKNNFGYASRGC